MSTVNFTANYIKTTNIQKFDGKKYVPCKANFVELTKDDIESVDKAAAAWNKPFSYRIANSLKKYHDVEQMHFYALTTQEDGFSKLNPKNIQSLSILRDKPDLKMLYLHFLQVNPKSMSAKNGSVFSQVVKFIGKVFNINNLVQQHKNVGSETIKCIQEQHKGSTMSLHSAYDARGFYEKLGFVNPDDCSVNTFIGK